MRILLAIDDSKCSEAATLALAKRVRTDHTEVSVLHVMEPLPTGIGGQAGAYVADIEAMRQGQLQKAEALVAGVANVLRLAGFNVTTLIEQGDPVTKIVDRAAAWKADLIMLGSHGRKGLARLLLGSVSEGVFRHAPCAVEIVRLPAERVAKAA